MESRVRAEDAKPIEVKAGESIRATVDKAPKGALIRVPAGEIRVVKAGAEHGWPDMSQEAAQIADWFDGHLKTPPAAAGQ